MKINIKHVLSAIFVLLLTSVIQAQEATFQWSEIENKSLVGFQNPILTFPKASGFTMYSVEQFGARLYAPEEVHITKLDASGKANSTITFNLPKRLQKDATLLKVLETENELYFFSFIAVKKDKKNVLYCQVYNNETGEVSEAKEIYVLPIEKVNNSGFFNVELSQDKKTVAVLINKPFVKKTKEKIEVLLLNNNLESIYNKKQTLSIESKRANTEELFVANDGTVTIIKKTDVFKKRPITTAISIKGEEISECQVSADKFYVSDNKVVTINDKQYLIGFATDNAKPTASIGGAKDKSFFIYNISDKKLIKNEGWKSEILKKILGKGFLHLSIKNVLVENEDIYIIGDSFLEKSTEIDGKNFEYNYDYTFGPGVVVKLNVNGDVAYQSFIKYGESYKNKERDLGSFYPYLNNGKLQILANQKEYILKNKKVVMGYKNINAKAIVLYTFDNTGNINIKPFWNSKVGGKNNLVSFAPTKSIRLNTNTFYIYAMGGERSRYGKMKIE